ncbi:MAG: hypothetical protein J3R72DRAFT_166162 [Linnemannia gamsii]|nr:MAG: hypothetical protein J3R72DRAFT_166162 [Linnemannia gamsii]
MFSPDTSSSYGTLGILPINVSIHHHHHHDFNHDSCDNFDSRFAAYHHNHVCTDSQQHSGGHYTSSKYLAISSSSASQTPLQPIKSSHPTTTQVQNIPYSTFAATPASAHPFIYNTTGLDNTTSWNTVHRNPELLHHQQRLLYQDLRRFSAQTAGTTYNNYNQKDAICAHTAVESAYTITAVSQEPTKTSLSNTHGTAAQLGGNGNNYNTDNNSNSNNNNEDEYADMSADNAADGDFIVRALHEYHTDSEGHLSFSQFQYIKVRHCDASGWWFGESENNRGWFPSNRVERVAAVYESEYLSRPTSITSEDYDQIRTGLDGVEIQFLGEPVMESITDSIQLDWGAVDNSGGVVNNATAHPPVVAIGRTRAGQLAFPPTQLSMTQPAYGSEASSTDMESEMFYQQPVSSSTSINTADITYAYSDFVSEVTQYVMELRDATAKSELERYQPTVAKIFSCVKALLIFTNTIARESPVLATYPELARSRRVILRALGKLYSKCRVANGAQSPTTTRQRQFATEKLVVFSGQVLEGITDFATCAREIGLRIRAEAASTQAVELEMLLTAKREANTTPPTSGSHGRPRRRVSRANSAKGFKSFNAVRLWKTEHLQKHNVAKKAVEFLLSEYMECLNGDQGTKELSRIVRTTIQSAHAVEAYLFSADDTRVRTHFREDEQYIIHKNKLSSTLTELFEFIQIMENVLTAKGPSSEHVLNRLMNHASVLLKCLSDLEIPSKSQGSNQEPSPLSVKRVSFSQDRPSSHAIPGTAADSKLFSRSVAPDDSPRVSEDQSIRQQIVTETTEAVETAETAVITPTTVPTAVIAPQKTTASRNTAPARPKPSTAPINSQTFPLNRKFASFNSHSEKNRRQAAVDQQVPEVDGSHLNPEAAYGEAHDLERNHVDFNRPNHDSAVVMSGKNTPHHSLLNGQKGAKPIIPVVPVVEEEEDLEEAAEPKEQPAKDDNTQEHLSGAVKEAERTITALFLPTADAPHQLLQVDVPTPDNTRQRVSLPIQVNPAVEGDNKSLRPILRQQYSFESQPIHPTRTSRTPTPEVEAPTPLQSALTPLHPALNAPGAPILRNKQILEVLESQERSREMTGLGVSIPAGTRPRNMSAPIPFATANQGAGSGTIPRPSGIARARSPIQSSPRLEASKRMPRRDPSPNSHSPNSNSESRTFSRPGGQASTNLSPGMQPGSRRGSENSIRSDMSLPRKSSDSQAMREHEPRQDYQDRRQQQLQHQPQYHQQQQQLAQAAGRRGSKASVNGATMRTEPQGAKVDDNVLSGLTTPTTPQVQTFQEGQQSTARRPAKNQRRESVASNLSVATESSIHSRSAGRPLSPSQRNRINNQYQDTNSIRGRVSTESTMSQPPPQHQQQARGGPSPTSYRARQNRIAPTRGRLSGEFKQEGNSATTATPWFLGDDYESDEVHYNDNGVLVAATLEAFIEMLTSHKNAPDSALVMTFFTTFRLFTSPLELTDLLIKRFMKLPPAGLSEQDLSIWTQQKQERVQKRYTQSKLQFLVSTPS